MKKLALIFIILSFGCSLKRTAVKTMADIMDEAASVYMEEEDLQTTKDTMLSAVKLSESLLRSDKHNEKLTVITSKGYCGYSFAFLEDENNMRAGSMYKKGMQFAENLLEHKKIIANGKLIKDVEFSDNEPLFWYAFCKAGYIKLNLHKPSALTQISGLEKIIDALIKVNPSYYYNGPYLLKGALLSRSPVLGGNYDKAKYYFDMALKGKGNKFKINKVIYAKTYAAQTLNRELFEKLLKSILAEKGIIQSEKLLEKTAIKKARKLLEEADEIF